PFHDSDAEVERRTGVDIPFIFEKEGEAGFRQREREAIEALTALSGIVLATGGGGGGRPRKPPPPPPARAGAFPPDPPPPAVRRAAGAARTPRPQPSAAGRGRFHGAPR